LAESSSSERRYLLRYVREYGVSTLDVLETVVELLVDGTVVVAVEVLLLILLVVFELEPRRPRLL
jgi:hypothetical protein